MQKIILKHGIQKNSKKNYQGIMMIPLYKKNPEKTQSELKKVREE